MKKNYSIYATAIINNTTKLKPTLDCQCKNELHLA